MQRLLPIVCNHLVVLMMGLIAVKLTSQWVPPDVYGRYALFLTLTQLGYLLTHSGLINHTARFWQRERGQSGTYAHFLWQQSWREGWCLAAVLSLIALGLAWFQHEPMWVWILPFLVIGNVAVALTAIANVALNAQESNWLVFSLGVVSSLRGLAPVAAVWLINATYLVLTAGFTVHGLMLMGFILALFRGCWRAPGAGVGRQEQWLQELRNYGRPFVWMGIGGWLLQNLDRWIVAQFYGAEMAGIFAMSSNIGTIIPSLVAGGLLQWVFPRVFRCADTAKTGRDWELLARWCDQLTLLFLVLGIAGMVALAWVGPHLVGWLIADRYAPAMNILLPVGIGGMIVQVNQFYYLLLQGKQDSVSMVRVMMLVAGLKTAGSLVAAAVSWEAFLGWLVVSVGAGGFLGRAMVRRLALLNPSRR